MEIQIKRAEQLPTQITQLAVLARKEGYEFLERLIEEYQNGKNRFDQPGEFLLLGYDGDSLIACGGLNLQYGDNGSEIDTRIGRVRRFYVHPDYRQHGVGKLLLVSLEKEARANFSALCLHTDTNLAAKFYQKHNYVYVSGHSNYNYFKYLI